MSRPRLSALPLWADREQECLEVLNEALSLLSTEPAQESDEDSINRRLMRCLDAVLHSRTRTRGTTIGPPAYESRSSPAPSDPQRTSREFKRPDFIWLWIDDLAVDPKLSRREFVVECKRLGPDPFPRRYVTQGVRRFADPAHAYAKDMRSGAMVGYLQSISIDVATQQVNAVAATVDVPPLNCMTRNGEDSATFEHQIARPFHARLFSLTHMWVRVT